VFSGGHRPRLNLEGAPAFTHIRSGHPCRDPDEQRKPRRPGRRRPRRSPISWPTAGRTPGRFSIPGHRSIASKVRYTALGPDRSTVPEGSTAAPWTGRGADARKCSPPLISSSRQVPVDTEQRTEPLRLTGCKRRAPLGRPLPDARSVALQHCRSPNCPTPRNRGHDTDHCMIGSARNQQ
jgi:hypothetical protein